ncbi:hypothetical protein PFICI_06700 [Pestalotiopsis fici W106-1]|uniref:GATA-type domain-containing protein n=1 Tax=Pestalotiopsis fici (strain W106-1 / CGMCC3.15140) TaxID=1229662 RepID=W3X6F5_PESFW|nr:uncharacterized protein PFICI_06700 [Pestalotiopsis fici W106-1]ETS81698.1 hypothetical protein PFICI_06700 [Pestalotiopsis fici W106-1]
MQSLKALDTHDATQKVRQFLEKSEQSVTSVESAELSFSSRLCSNILELFREVFLLLSNSDTPFLSRAEYISLERSFGQLKLWSDGYGVSTGELDDLLDKSRLLRRDTLKLLRSIGINLTERLLPQLFGKSSMTESLGLISNGLKAVLESYHDDDGESTSSGESDDSLEDNVQEMTKDLQTDTLCLMELGELFREPVVDSVRDAETSASHEALLGWAPYQAFCDKVGTRFPLAVQLLVARLGKANYERCIRCQQLRHNQEIKTVTEDSRNPPLYLAPKGSTFHDSGLGSSIPSATSYAETMLSYGSTNGRSVHVPALPSDGKSRKPFACLVCGKLVNISNNSAWKQHIYSDLRPWLCLDMSCSNGDTSFENRNDWISHLALDHNLEPRWRSFECPLCHAETGAGKVAVTRHLEAHLEEISLAALPIDVDSESDSESDDERDADLGSREGQSETLLEAMLADPLAPLTPAEYGIRGSPQYKSNLRAVLDWRKSMLSGPQPSPLRENLLAELDDKADQRPISQIKGTSDSPEKHHQNTDSSNGECSGERTPAVKPLPTHSSAPLGPKAFDGTITDVYGDKLYSPHSAITDTAGNALGFSSVTPSRPSSPLGSKQGSTTNLQGATGNQADSNTPTTCTNCFTQITPLWRRNYEGQIICNACGLFLKSRGFARPSSFKTDVIKKRNRGPGANPPVGGTSTTSASPQTQAQIVTSPDNSVFVPTPRARK